MNYKKILSENFDERKKIECLKEIYNLNVEEIISLDILDTIYNLLTRTKELDFEQIVYSNVVESKNKEIIKYCLKIITKVGREREDLVYLYIPYIIKLLDSEVEDIKRWAAEALSEIPSSLTIYSYPKLIKEDGEKFTEALFKIIVRAKNKEAILLKIFENFNISHVKLIKKLYNYDKELVKEFIPLLVKYKVKL
ncbi:conserved hypothetical protein [Methanocaldococcus infernus ME]|uniref:HEAT domain containing protein n=1 Tax=Methanocaldococcus infernus (strain DSM 11812 / JCM 15783 / ME) TaxID=573063 RepID=D5VSP2_METIM|nr:hypothetical protein [Methanocaldococcus infernus]ADG13595.1 conserved hypothetical protein [Methanocaldococcus infernus ME]